MGSLIGYNVGLMKPNYFKGILMMAPAFDSNTDYSYIPKLFVEYIGQYIIPKM